MANKPFKLPRTLAECADKLYETREARHAIQKEADKLAEIESQLREHIIANLPKDEASGIAGKVARVSLEKKAVPTVEDWSKVQAYIKKHNAFDLLQRRLNETAVKDRAENGKPVPNVGSFITVKVSCTKV